MIEAEYCRIVHLRLLFRIEEIVTERLIGEDSLVFGTRRPKRQKLLDMRVLIGIACQGITFFEERCRAHGVDLDFADINRRCIRSNRAFQLLEPFLDRSTDLEEFTDFQDYCDVAIEDHQVVDECDDSNSSSDLGYERRREWLEYTPFPDEPVDNSSTFS
jgi:hypothetical protein